MKPRRFPLRLWAGLALVVAAFIAWWVVESRETSVSLPGGGKVVLLGTTYGVNHRFSEGSSWVKLIRRWISPQQAVKLGFRSYLHQSPGTNLVIWTYVYSSATNGSGLGAASVADERGIESEPNSPAVYATIPKRSEALVAWQFNNFPRRSAKIRLRFYDLGISFEGGDVGNNPRCIAEMAIPNPVQTRLPIWKAPHAPVTVKSGELGFTLTELRSGDEPLRQVAPARAAVAPWTSIAFVVASNDQPDPSWRLRRLEGVSATGNSFAVPVPQSRRRENEMVTGTYHVFWPEDGAWRIRAEFSREGRLPFDQTWAFRNVTLRPGNPTVLSNLTITVQGITLTNLEVSMLAPSVLQPALALRNVEVKLGFAPSIPGVRVDLIEATDERGRRLEFNPSFEFPPGTYSTRLGAPTGVQAVNLTFAIRPSHIVDFLVTPEFVTSNAPSTFPGIGRAATNTTK